MRNMTPIDYVEVEEYTNQSTLDAVSSEYVAMRHPMLDTDEASMRAECVRRFIND